MKVALSAFVLGLLTLIYWQWHDWPPAFEWQSQPQTTGVRDTDADIEAAPELLAQLDAREDKDAYAQVIERPLFQPDRRPPKDGAEPETAEKESEARELDVFDLNAVIMTPAASTAWVLDGPNHSLLKVRPGEDLAGWVVREIRADRLLLERQGESDTLLLRNYSAPRASQAPRAGSDASRSARRRPPTPPNRQQGQNARRSP